MCCCCCCWMLQYTNTLFPFLMFHSLRTYSPVTLLFPLEIIHVSPLWIYTLKSTWSHSSYSWWWILSFRLHSSSSQSSMCELLWPPINIKRQYGLSTVIKACNNHGTFGSVVTILPCEWEKKSKDVCAWRMPFFPLLSTAMEAKIASGYNNCFLWFYYYCIAHCASDKCRNVRVLLVLQ